jgi:hypothetical protein
MRPFRSACWLLLFCTHPRCIDLLPVLQDSAIYTERGHKVSFFELANAQIVALASIDALQRGKKGQP